MALAAARLATPARTSRAFTLGLGLVVERFNIIGTTPGMGAAPGTAWPGNVRGAFGRLESNGWPARTPRARRPKGRFSDPDLSIAATPRGIRRAKHPCCRKFPNRSSFGLLARLLTKHATCRYLRPDFPRHLRTHNATELANDCAAANPVARPTCPLSVCVPRGNRFRRLGSHPESALTTM